jgi:RimJ/RimL family protein N-acetyltransferase
MNQKEVTIIPFQSLHQRGIDELMDGIVQEFEEQIYPANAKTIAGIAALPANKYWVALVGETVIGTIGLAALNNNAIAVKRMFLKKGFRGAGVAKMMLDKLIGYALENNIPSIYLGTMVQFKAAQKFYEKNGFEEITESELPKDFAANPVDKVFYRMGLKYNPSFDEHMHPDSNSFY